MKQQILFTAVIIYTATLFSCSKESRDSETKQVAEQSPSITSSGARILPLSYKLEGNYSFDQTLKDQTGKLADAVPTSRIVSFTTDRKGNLKKALYLDSTYGVKIKTVPQQTNTSLSLWIKPANVYTSSLCYIAAPDSYGPVMNQVSNLISCGVVMNVTTPGVANTYLSEKGWHHLVVTYDGTTVRAYLDGVLSGTNTEAGFIPASLPDYFIGCFPGFGKWKGAIDDLRFYSRTLSANDVTALYNL